MARQPNIVQAEFFYVREVGGFQLDVQLKTVVRFFDYGGLVTDVVVRLSKARKEELRLTQCHEDLFPRPEDWRGQVIELRKRFLRWRLVRLSRKINALEQKRKDFALRQLASAMRTPEHAAVERPGYRFRLVQPKERYELLGTALSATSVWLFVFGPNDLLADTNTSVAYAL